MKNIIYLNKKNNIPRSPFTINNSSINEIDIKDFSADLGNKLNESLSKETQTGIIKFTVWFISQIDKSGFEIGYNELMKFKEQSFVIFEKNSISRENYLIFPIILLSQDFDKNLLKKFVVDGLPRFNKIFIVDYFRNDGLIIGKDLVPLMDNVYISLKLFIESFEKWDSVEQQEFTVNALMNTDPGSFFASFNSEVLDLNLQTISSKISYSLVEEMNQRIVYGATDFNEAYMEIRELLTATNVDFYDDITASISLNGENNNSLELNDLNRINASDVNDYSKKIFQYIYNLPQKINKIQIDKTKIKEKISNAFKEFQQSILLMLKSKKKNIDNIIYEIEHGQKKLGEIESSFHKAQEKIEYNYRNYIIKRKNDFETLSNEIFLLRNSYPSVNKIFFHAFLLFIFFIIATYLLNFYGGLLYQQLILAVIGFASAILFYWLKYKRKYDLIEEQIIQLLKKIKKIINGFDFNSLLYLWKNTIVVSVIEQIECNLKSNCENLIYLKNKLEERQNYTNQIYKQFTNTWDINEIKRLTYKDNYKIDDDYYFLILDGALKKDEFENKLQEKIVERLFSSRYEGDILIVADIEKILQIIVNELKYDLWYNYIVTAQHDGLGGLIKMNILVDFLKKASYSLNQLGSAFIKIEDFSSVEQQYKILVGNQLQIPLLNNIETNFRNNLNNKLKNDFTKRIIGMDEEFYSDKIAIISIISSIKPYHDL